MQIHLVMIQLIVHPMTFVDFLEKNNILETGGCPSNTNRE
jgi:hypothetical protein